MANFGTPQNPEEFAWILICLCGAAFFGSCWKGFHWPNFDIFWPPFCLYFLNAWKMEVVPTRFPLTWPCSQWVEPFADCRVLSYMPFRATHVMLKLVSDQFLAYFHVLALHAHMGLQRDLNWMLLSLRREDAIVFGGKVLEVLGK